MVSVSAKHVVSDCFTLEQIEVLLPKIEKMMLKLQVLDTAVEMLESVELDVEEDNLAHVQYMMKFNKEFHKLCYKYYQLAEKLGLLGVIIKDIEEGLVDFPYMYRGKKVLLCWKMGEEKVGHWHEVDECYDERKKIVDLNMR